MCSQLFQLFDSNKDGVIEFGEFIRGLSVFHPSAPQAQKADCNISSEKCVVCMLYSIYIEPFGV